MYNPSTGGISLDNFTKTIISSNSSIFCMNGRDPPIDLHKFEASSQDLLNFPFGCCLGHLLSIGMV